MRHNKPFLIGFSASIKVCEPPLFSAFHLPGISAHRLLRDFRHNFPASLVKHKVFTWRHARQLPDSLFRHMYIARRFYPHKTAIALPSQDVQMGCAHNPRSLVV
jgi:hypothetical protein